MKSCSGWGLFLRRTIVGAGASGISTHRQHLRTGGGHMQKAPGMNDSEGFGKPTQCRTVSRETVFRSRRQVGLLTSALSYRLRLPTPRGSGWSELRAAFVRNVGVLRNPVRSTRLQWRGREGFSPSSRWAAGYPAASPVCISSRTISCPIQYSTMNRNRQHLNGKNWEKSLSTRSGRLGVVPAHGIHFVVMGSHEDSRRRYLPCASTSSRSRSVAASKRVQASFSSVPTATMSSGSSASGFLRSAT